jgi:uncharacterized membrane protein
MTAPPHHLIVVFTIGVVAFIAGVLASLASIFVARDVFGIVGAVSLALGSAMVVLALLRGQDLDERAG